MPLRFLTASILGLGVLFSGASLWAQSTGIAFGAMALDPEAPVNVASDQLNVNQTDGTAIFLGNVAAAQGELKLNAQRVEIEYTPEVEGEKRKISRLLAYEDVTLVTPTEAAEADEAVYSILDSTVVMTGNVLLVQGPNVISGDKLTVDLTTGIGNMSGRVRTTLQSESDGQ